MYRLVRYEDKIAAEWDRLAASNGTIFHTTGFRRVLIESFGYQCAYHAVLNSGNQVCGLLPLIISRNLRMQKVGVSLPFVNYVDICVLTEDAATFLFNKLNMLASLLGVSYIQLRSKKPDIRFIEDSGWHVASDNYTLELPLLHSEEKTLYLATSSCRNHVRKTYKNSWFRVSFEPDRLVGFYKVYSRRMKQLGCPAPSIAFFQNIFKWLPESAVLLTVSDNVSNAIVGGMLLLLSPSNEKIYYSFGASLIEYNRQYVNNFMYWEAIKYGIIKGMKCIDLGRSVKDSGTYKYKIKWGAKPVQLSYMNTLGCAAFDSLGSRERFKVAAGIWQRLPGFVTAPLGPKLIKHILP